MKQPSLKRQLISDVVFSWIIFAGLFVTIAIEASLEAPWTRITNALWIIEMVTLAFFMGRGFNRLVKYLRESHPKN